ncbi:MAG TPA: hypothetical protein VFQ85_06460 [Mycobacteriales bacterium]|jgi:uncharacterized membrane protein YhaH (DUF805 family)|nr:hypothetical protein [Mycobacteriales bacterium]
MSSPYRFTYVTGDVAAVLVFVLLAFGLLLRVRIARKAGFSAWWAVLSLIPFAGFVVEILFAFVRWPVERELATLRAENAHLRDELAAARPPS